ncbi:MAG: acyltransferase [Panacagrimonas sp.]
MLQFLPAPVLGTIMLLMLLLNTLFWVVPVYTLILLKLLTPSASAPRQFLSRAVAWNAQRWAVINAWAANTLLGVEWDIRIDADLRKDGQYLVCCNHQTWTDIVVLMRTFGSQAPFFKFFLKQELIWVPLLGLAWWGLDYPFMKRYTRDQIAKRPELAGKDLETTKRACDRFKNQPVMILNFLEGTRFTAEKHARQSSPYAHLLKPKSGGFAFAMAAMGERLNCLLDITIVYPQGAKGQWDFLAGRVRKVIVDVKQVTIPAELFEGQYDRDPAFRAQFHRWVGRLWSEKDQKIKALLAQANA